MSQEQRAERYAAIAIVLHWAIAILIIGQIAAGLWMASEAAENGDRALRFAVIQMHKSFGITVLVLTAARIAWRLLNPPPPLPAGMSAIETLAARAVHAGFYALMIALPLTGWAMASASPTGLPIILFNVAEWPQLPLPRSRDLHEAFEEVHEYLAYAAIALLALHVAGALKHQLLDKENILGRMLGAGASAPGRGLAIALIAPVALVGLVMAAGAMAPDRPAPAAGAAEEHDHHHHGDGDDHDAPDEDADTTAAAAMSVAADTGAADTGAADASDQDHEHASPAAVEAETPAAAEPEAAAAEATSEPASTPVRWTVDAGASRIAFSGVQSGQPFDGAFSSWRAEIVFDPERTSGARAEVVIDAASAATGDAYLDGALPTQTWFDVGAHPEARFVATSFRATAAGAYEATGDLTIKGVTRPVTFPFTLALDGDAARAEGSVTLDRRAFALGTDDPDSDGAVSGDIVVSIHVEAARAE